MIQNEKTPQNDRLSAKIVKNQFTVFDFVALLIIIVCAFENQNSSNLFY
jgi:hypothetical protein